jgi:hypothetical protein
MEDPTPFLFFKNHEKLKIMEGFKNKPFSGTEGHYN